MDAEIKKYSMTLWDFLVLNDSPTKCDVIIAHGSYDTRIVEKAAQLFKEGFAQYILISGGFGRLSGQNATRTEAEIFRDVTVSMGVPEDKIILENKSTNTQTNITYSKAALEQSGIPFSKLIAIQLPYILKRTAESYKINWPDADIIFVSPVEKFDDYPNELVSEEELIHLMVGEVSRLQVYPAKGFIGEVEIPAEVENAYTYLIEKGFTKHKVE